MELIVGKVGLRPRQLADPEDLAKKPTSDSAPEKKWKWYLPDVAEDSDWWHVCQEKLWVVTALYMEPAWIPPKGSRKIVLLFPDIVGPRNHLQSALVGMAGDTSSASLRRLCNVQ